MSHVSLKGRLNSFHLSEIFQSFVMGRRSGMLRVKTPNRQKLLYLSEGQIQRVTSGGGPPTKLGDILIKAGRIRETQLHDAISHHVQHGIPVGESMMALGFITPEELRFVLTMQIQEEICDLFTWQDATFEFLEDVDPEELFSEFGFTQQQSHVHINTQSVILEAARRIDEWENIRENMPDRNCIFIRLKEVMPGDPKNPWGVYSQIDTDMLDGRHTLEEIIDSTFLSEFSVCKIIMDLIDRQVIRALTPEECFKMGLEALKSQTPHDTERFFKACLRLSPNLLAAQERVTRAYLDQGFRQHAARSYRRMARHKLAQGDIQGGLANLQAGHQIDPANMDLAENLFVLLLALEMHESCLEVADHLLAAYQKDDAQDAAQRRMEELCLQILQIHPTHIVYNVALSRLRERHGNQEQALHMLLALEKPLMVAKSRDGLERLYRRILEIDPARKDIQHKLRVATRGQRMEKYRMVALTTVICLASVSILITLQYYLCGQRAYRQLQSQEPDLLAHRRSGYLLNKYHEIAVNNPFTKAKKAALMDVERIRNLVTAWEQEDRKRSMNLNAQALLEEGTAARSAGNLEAAFGAFRTLLTQYGDTPSAAKVKLPIRIHSSPSGAAIFAHDADTTPLGRTPMILDYDPKTISKLIIRLPTFQQATIDLDREKYQHVQLALRKLTSWEAGIQVPVEVSPARIGNVIYLLARDGNLYTLDSATGDRMATVSIGAPGDIFCAPAVLNKRIFWGRSSGHVVAYHASRKRRLWRQVTGGPILHVVPAGNDTLLLAASEDGRLYAYDPASGTPSWSFQTRHHVTGASADTKNGRIFLTSRDNRVYCLQEKDGRRIWEFETADDCALGPVFAHGSVFVISNDHNCYALDSDTGRLRWRHPVASDVRASPVVHAGALFFVDADGRMTALDLTTGHLLWTFSMQSEGWAQPAPAGRILLLASRAGILYAVTIDGGRIEWQIDLASEIKAPPLVVNHQAVVASLEGKVWLIKL